MSIYASIYCLSESDMLIPRDLHILDIWSKKSTTSKNEKSVLNDIPTNMAKLSICGMQ